MNRYRALITIMAVSVMLLGLTVAASAQRRGRNNDDYYGRNNVNISYAIKNVRNMSRRFEDDLDRALDNSRYDGTAREDHLNRLAGQFKNAAEDLDDEYEGRRRNRSSADEARRLINTGAQLDQALTRSRIVNRNFNLQNTWRNIEANLNTIARAYNIRYSGTYGRVRDDRPYGNDDRGNRRNRGNRGVNRNLRGTIVSLKNASNRLEDRIEDQYGGNLEDLAERFKDAVDDLEDEYDDRSDYNDSYDEVRRVLSLGEQMDQALSQRRVSNSIRSDWNRIENDLRVLANAYNIRYSSGRGIGRIGDILRDWPF